MGLNPPTLDARELARRLHASRCMSCAGKDSEHATRWLPHAKAALADADPAERLHGNALCDYELDSLPHHCPDRLGHIRRIRVKFLGESRSNAARELFGDQTCPGCKAEHPGAPCPLQSALPLDPEEP